MESARADCEPELTLGSARVSRVGDGVTPSRTFPEARFGETPQPVRIAMWSGPRNISTAMMRSWGNRPDTFVCDEPFYAYYLKETGRDLR
jgi:hypothetical protein